VHPPFVRVNCHPGDIHPAALEMDEKQHVVGLPNLMEYEEATSPYRKKMADCDRLFRLAPPMPSPVLSHRDDEAGFCATATAGSSLG
jgi:hypothetical protein